MLDRRPVDSVAAPPSSLPVPTMHYPSQRHHRPARLSWVAWYELYHTGIYAASNITPEPFSRTRRCPPLSLALQPADLTWSRDEAHQPALSKALTLCKLLNAVHEYELSTGKSPSDAINATAERFTVAWSKNKEFALKGARVFFARDSAKYSGEALTDYYSPPLPKGKRGREGEGTDCEL